MISMTKLSVFALAAGLMFGPEVAFAGAADKYVKGLVGKWRGGGTVTINDRGKTVKLRCSTQNTLDEAKRTLTMKGRCASSQGTRPLRGKIQYSANGAAITSVSLKIAGRGGVSAARLSGNTLTLSSTDKTEAGKSVPTRSVISGGGSRYSISLNAKSKGVWEKRGTLSFKR